MTRKKVWLTWMASEDGPHPLAHTGQLLAQYGLEVAGGPWVDDLEQMAWLEVGTAVSDVAQADLWLIAGDMSHLATPRWRYGLSLIAAMVQARRSAGVPIICLGLDDLPASATLPTLLRSGVCVGAADANWPAKVVAAAFTPAAPVALEVYFGVHAHPLLGQWFEAGPRGESWTGVMLGVAEGSIITQHAVGPRGQLPERAVLEYPSQGIQAQVGDTLYHAWAVQNQLSPEESYYVKVEGFPARLIIGGHAGADQAEVFVLDLQ